MPYGAYNGPDKGLEGGSCNRSTCQDSPAIWYNHGSLSWYCESCRRDIEFDSFNYTDWERNWRPQLGHPMFETRGMMEAREAQGSKVVYEDSVFSQDSVLDSLTMDVITALAARRSNSAPGWSHGRRAKPNAKIDKRKKVKAARRQRRKRGK